MTDLAAQPAPVGTEAEASPAEAERPEVGRAGGSPPRRGTLFDAGWLLLIPGIALVALTVLLPAFDDLDEARFYQQRMAKIEEHRQARMQYYNDYLQSLKRGDETTVLAQAALQLNKAPEGKVLLVPAGDIAHKSASVFEQLEPAPLALPERQREYSTLEKLAKDRQSRVWLMLAGATLILLGVLPPGRGSGGAATGR